ncbi:hypothetical protein C1H46_019615 [Malus baccata]|uniref:Uncharacterized protein n=1 Tax=Malus baccata TaxID=106549 RepID=A0A540M7N3_MALBA|nr:hypothetical protein C1H46_019615 [Malus baccata]
MRIPFDHLLPVLAPPIAIIEKINFTPCLSGCATATSTSLIVDMVRPSFYRSALTPHTKPVSSEAMEPSLPMSLLANRNASSAIFLRLMR